MSNRNNKILCRLLSLMLVLAMLVSLVGCGSLSADSTGTSASTTQSTPPATQPATDPTTQPTDPTTQPTDPTTQPTDPTEPSEPPQEEPRPETDLVYELTQADVDAYYQYLADCEALSLVGEDLDAIDAATTLLDESYEYLNAQCSIAMILHYSHTSNEELEQQYLDCVDICTEANDAYLQMARRVYLSDTPAKDHLFEGWTEADIDNLLKYDEQIVQLQQRNAEIGVEYRATGSDSKKIELYIEFVQNNNQMAQIYGYENYYEYAYEMGYDRDYSPEALEQMRQYAKDYLTEAFQSAYLGFYRAFYLEAKPADQLVVQNFLYEDYDSIGTDYVGNFMEIVPEPLREALNSMLTEDSLFTSAGDAMSGAFTTTIGDRSYCFFGPGYASCKTVIHEGGHYYASLYTDLNGIPLDLAETHSQGNEWLFMNYLQGVMPEKQYNAILEYSLYESIAMILICLMVDEFEQQVYTTDISGYTSRHFDAMMDKIALQYFPMGNVEESLADMNYYWRQVVVDQPVYYVSYAVSSVAAMSLYTIAQENMDTALDVYCKLCQEPLEEAGFLGNIQAAGLYSPFDEQFYLELLELLKN